MAIDTAEVVLLFVLAIIAMLLVVLGVQVFFILRELRQTVSKANKVLDDTGMITESVSGPLTKLSSLAAGVKAGTAIASFFARRSEKSKEPDKKKEEKHGK